MFGLIDRLDFSTDGLEWDWSISPISNIDSPGSKNVWMKAFETAYAYSCVDPGWAVCRSIVPGVMVDPRGTLFTVTPDHFGGLGLGFSVRSIRFDASGNLYECSAASQSWEKREAIDKRPNFGSEDFFRWSFYNVFHPCIVQEMNDVCSTCFKVGGGGRRRGALGERRGAETRRTPAGGALER